MGNDSMSKTLLVAFVLCIICSILVSTAAVSLKPMQQKNKLEDLQRNILMAAGLYQPELTVAEQFSRVTVKAVDLSTGRYSDEVDPTTYDQRKAAKDESLSDKLTADDDIAKINRLEKYSLVYLIENDTGIDKIILPIRGYGLWSTLYGFVALENDMNTIAGLGFYEHAETPGLSTSPPNPGVSACS